MIVRQALISSLRIRLLLLVLLGILPVLGLVLHSTVQQRQNALEDTRQEALRVARIVARTQQQNIESSRQLLVTLSQIRNLASREDAGRSFMANLLQIHPIYANLGIIDLDGYVIASAAATTNKVFLGDRSYFQRATNTLKFSVGDYQIGRITGKPTLNMALPVKDAKTGQLKNILFAALDLNWISTLIGRADLPDGSTLTIVDRNGVVLVRYPDPKRLYTGLIATNVPGSKRLLTMSREGTSRSRGLDGVSRLYAFTPLTKSEGLADAWAFIGIPTATIARNANILLIQNLIFLGIVGLAALAVAWFGSDWFVLRQVRLLLDTTRRLTGGDLKARTGIESATGELNQLGHAFDEMASALEQRVIEKEQAQNELSTLNEQLEKRVALRTSELERSNRDLEQFAYVVSHDLQEPLRSVSGFLQILQQRAGEKLDQENREFLQYALDGGKRMQQLIADLLAYARVGQSAKSAERVNGEDLLIHVLHNLDAAIKERGAHIEHDAMPALKGDPVQISQVFQNLISNALKFKSERPLQIEIRAIRQSEGWQFAIRDNGIGIEPKDFERIFVIFQRLHTQGEYPGTGIGLSICKKIVEAHGGRIWLESKPGQGTTFYFTLPAAE
jgi:signal transduction histidine kinase